MAHILACVLMGRYTRLIAERLNPHFQRQYLSHTIDRSLCVFINSRIGVPATYPSPRPTQLVDHAGVILRTYADFSPSGCYV